MNKGIVVGNVFLPTGRPAAKVWVRMRRIEHSMGPMFFKGAGEYGVAEAQTDARGKFVIPFLWEASDIAHNHQGFQNGFTITVVAFEDGTGPILTAKAVIPGQLHMDISSLKFSTPGASERDLDAFYPGLAKLVKGYIKGRFWNTGLFTTSFWLLYGRADMTLGKTVPQREAELIEEVQTSPGKKTGTADTKSHQCSCQKPKGKLVPPSGNLGETDPESFAKSVLRWYLQRVPGPKEILGVYPSGPQRLERRRSVDPLQYAEPLRNRRELGKKSWKRQPLLQESAAHAYG
ncbi:MAG: hypothetical protein EOP04_28605 [Proteobacteria bacterium]|nr:MAG: hypothetical protein EOP04_28605 [Pseudomonadota bacterium]